MSQIVNELGPLRLHQEGLAEGKGVDGLRNSSRPSPAPVSPATHQHCLGVYFFFFCSSHKRPFHCSPTTLKKGITPFRLEEEEKEAFRSHLWERAEPELE